MDNLELNKQLIELSSQALDMQNEISRLTAENAELKKCRDIETRIERHSEPYVTLKDDSKQTLFCSHCWDYEQKLIQVRCHDSGTFKCTHCENHGIYDSAKHDAGIQRTEIINENRRNNRNFW